MRNTTSISSRFALWGLLSVALTSKQVIAEPVSIVSWPSDIVGIFRNHCFDCHGDGANEGGFSLEDSGADWTDEPTRQRFELAYDLVSRRIMPPPDAEPLSDPDHERLLSELEQKLVEHSPIGGMSPRRLSRREYATTIQELFGLNDFELPDSFPVESLRDGFDNQAEALTTSASHLEALSETAALVADELFPVSPARVRATTTNVTAADLTISYSSAALIDGQMRLASSGKNLARNATFPARFEAPARGIYEISVTATAVAADKPAILELSGKSSRKTMLKDAEGDRQTMQFAPGQTQTRRVEMELSLGDTITMRYSNGPYRYDDSDELRDFLFDLFRREPELAAAWDSVGNPARGGSGWDRVTERIGAGDLDTDAYRIGDDGKPSPQLAALVKRMAVKNVNTGETLVFKYFAEGPYVGIGSMKIHGPIRELPDREHQRRLRQQQRWLAKYDTTRETLVSSSAIASSNDNAPEHAAFVGRFLGDAFRRVPSPAEVKAYTHLLGESRATGGEFDDAMHLLIRTTLISPAFLHRGLEAKVPGVERLSPHALATRLSYFLTSGPPDQTLRQWAVRTDRTGFDFAARRSWGGHIPRLVEQTFAKDFTRQWLRLHSLDHLMPDARLMKSFTPQHRDVMIEEVWRTFLWAMRENRPAVDLISPGFVLANPKVGEQIYGFSKEELKAKRRGHANSGNKSLFGTLNQYSVDAGGYRGGLLGMPAIMMATANGVDTQPVMRGVWVLENILGTPPPEPPDAVPALTPDTSTAKTPKQQLALHMNDASCASCHREIDPLGFALEVFDPIGRVRDHYPKYIDRNGKVRQVDGPAIDASGVLPNGADIQDVRDLKRWLVDHPEAFIRCLSEKLMTYATGRQLNFAERRRIAEIVESQSSNDYRLMDLLVALVQSEFFLNR